ncbi:histidine phosphatase family protein [Paenibacillus sp. IHBB 3054]|uniref:histidine phosphatase family protein n=1 Tax=Paenibacillus sp. IHBB 3054 TaxID=3425689 RepID=UPI003F66CC14
MKEIILIQHTQSEHHVNHMSGGWTDTPLTVLGRQQAARVGIRLTEVLTPNEYVLYSSDLLRAKQTAEIIGSHLGLSLQEDNGLREINSGVATGQTKEWAREHRNPRISDHFDIDHREFPEGETWREVYNRVCNVMARICTEEQKHLIIVTHGGTLGYIVAWWLGFEPVMLNQAYFPGSVGSISRLGQNSYQQHSLQVFNDTSHLQG